MLNKDDEGGWKWRGISNDRLLSEAQYESVINKTASACYVGSLVAKQLGTFA